MSYVANLEHTHVMVLPLARLWSVPCASALPLFLEGPPITAGRSRTAWAPCLPHCRRCTSPSLEPIARPPVVFVRPVPLDANGRAVHAVPLLRTGREPPGDANRIRIIIRKFI